VLPSKINLNEQFLQVITLISSSAPKWNYKSAILTILFYKKKITLKISFIMNCLLNNEYNSHFLIKPPLL
jgi:hypothetical protein